MEASSYLGHGECGHGTKSAQQDACCRHDRRVRVMPGTRPPSFQDGKMPSCNGNRGVQIFHRSVFNVQAKVQSFRHKKGHEMGTRCMGPRNGHQLALLFAENFASFRQGWWNCTLQDHLEAWESGPGVSSQHRHHQPWCDAQAARVAASRVTNSMPCRHRLTRAASIWPN